MMVERRAVLVHPKAPVRLAPVALRVPSPDSPEALLMVAEIFPGRGEVSRARVAEFQVRFSVAVEETSVDATGDAVGGAVEAR